MKKIICISILFFALYGCKKEELSTKIQGTWKLKLVEPVLRNEFGDRVYFTDVVIFFDEGTTEDNITTGTGGAIKDGYKFVGKWNLNPQANLLSFAFSNVELEYLENANLGEYLIKKKEMSLLAEVLVIKELNSSNLRLERYTNSGNKIDKLEFTRQK